MGIGEVVYAQDYGMDHLTKELFNEAGVVLRQISNLAVNFNIGTILKLQC